MNLMKSFKALQDLDRLVPGDAHTRIFANVSGEGWTIPCKQYDLHGFKPAGEQPKVIIFQDRFQLRWLGGYLGAGTVTKINPLFA
jgi:hypothetical protein